MRLLVIIACLLLATNLYASQAKDANGNDTQQETKDANGRYVQQESPKASPSWAGADAEPPFNDDKSLQPSHDDTDEPSFGDDGQHE